VKMTSDALFINKHKL